MTVNDSIEILSELAGERPRLLAQEKGARRKIVGYSGSQVAEILIMAAGGAPLSLCRVGFVAPTGGAAAPNHEDTLAPLLDLVVVRQVDDARRAVHQGREVNEVSEVPVADVPVPRDWESPFAVSRYRDALIELQATLEETTGHPVTKGGLRRVLADHNEVQRLVASIDALRRRDDPPISGLDFLRLNHACFDVDRQLLLPWLEGIHQELHHAGPALQRGAPRLLLAGRILAIGDTAVPQMVEAAGGAIVTEMLDEGLQPFRSPIDVDGDLYGSMAEATYLRSPPLLDFRLSTWKRFEAIRRRMDAYRAQGVLWMQLPRDRVADLEAACFAHWLGAEGIPFVGVRCAPGGAQAIAPALAERLRRFVGSVAACQSDQPEVSA